jgi:hypothetical protein
MSYQHAQDNWFAAILIAFIALAVLVNILRARMGAQLYIRRIPGLDAIDEAIGRSTELGRPVTMIPGLTTFGVVAVQALTIFKYITKQIARFATPMRLLSGDPTVFAVAQEAGHREALVCADHRRRGGRRDNRRHGRAHHQAAGSARRLGSLLE